jgi:hypothetical protein
MIFSGGFLRKSLVYIMDFYRRFFKKPSVKIWILVVVFLKNHH